MPEQIKVGPHTYRVAQFPAAQMISADGEKLLGECKQDELLIKILKRMRRTKTQEVLWHEVKHSAHYLAGHNEEENFDGEQWIEITAQNELQIMRDNPELVAYLTS